MEAQDSHISQSGPGPEPEDERNSTSEGSEGENGTESSAETHPEPAPSLDLIFEILKNSRRREALRYLREADERVSLGELAEHIAALENDTTVKQLTSSQRKRVYVGLYQCHLPKMDDIGVVEFNQDRGHVTLTEQIEHFERYMDEEEETVRRWHRYYGGVALAGGLALIPAIAAGAPTWMFSVVLLAVIASVGAVAAVDRRRSQ